MVESTAQLKPCLNCGDKLTGDFCRVCGQSADTERYTATAVAHETYHALRKFDLTTTAITIWELARRPGTFVREYLEGKRVGFTNPVRFFFFAFVAEILLRTAINHLAGPNFVQDTNVSSTWVQIFDFVATVFWGVLWRVFYPKSGLNASECAVAGLYFQGETGFLALVLLVATIPFRYLAPASVSYLHMSDLMITFVYSYIFAFSLFGESFIKTVIKQSIILVLFFLLLIGVVVSIKLTGINIF